MKRRFAAIAVASLISLGASTFSLNSAAPQSNQQIGGVVAYMASGGDWHTAVSGAEVGGAIGGFGGVIVGGMVGAAAGGVGAIPGAAAGAVIGGIAGGL